MKKETIYKSLASKIDAVNEYKTILDYHKVTNRFLLFDEITTNIAGYENLPKISILNNVESNEWDNISRDFLLKRIEYLEKNINDLEKKLRE